MKRHVHIIESPSAGDFYAGRREGSLLVEGLKLLEIPHKYQIATNEEIFKKALEDVECNNVTLGQPLLHLSMHGDADGLVLSDKHQVAWDYLKSQLVPINAKLNGGLILCMSSCKGINGIRMALGTPKDELPFSIIIGSPVTMLLSDLALGFLTFYNYLLSKDKDIDEALNAMQVAAGNAYFYKILASQVT